MTANQILASAIQNGYDGLSTRDLMLCILFGAQTGGGGSAALSDSIAVAGPPVGTPAANGLLNIIVDSNGRQWNYYGGAWN